MLKAKDSENNIIHITNEIEKHYLSLYKNRNKEREENGGELLHQLERIREIAIGCKDLKVALEAIKFWAKIMGLENGTTIDIDAHRVEIFKLPDNERIYEQ